MQSLKLVKSLRMRRRTFRGIQWLFTGLFLIGCQGEALDPAHEKVVYQNHQPKLAADHSVDVETVSVADLSAPLKLELSEAVAPKSHVAFRGTIERGSDDKTGSVIVLFQQWHNGRRMVAGMGGQPLPTDTRPWNYRVLVQSPTVPGTYEVQILLAATGREESPIIASGTVIVK